MGVLITLFLCGDVMLGRGIDQILPHSVDPTLHESYVKNAKRYVELAEQESGPIDAPVDFSYVWGDALDELKRINPDVRIINLETAITTSEEFWPDKGIHYRMHPKNVSTLTAARIDCCVVANNHALDWGYAGLTETLNTLRQANTASAGAGEDLQESSSPAVLTTSNGSRVLVYAFGSPTSGVYEEWAATKNQPGLNYLPSLAVESFEPIVKTIKRHARARDIVIASIHWGGNWGYRIPRDQIEFAHRLIGEAGVDIVHGHSSHHVKGLEVYQDRLILYGCGDFLNDYEGIGGHERYRSDLTLMYFPTVDATTGKLKQLRLAPMEIRNMKLNRAQPDDTQWLRDTLNRESKRFGVRVETDDQGDLMVNW
jgi:poly-gamma-glutamate synthesis protein (capsule biosynthesis protein)